MEAPPLERRLAAILAADVEGYSRLMHGDEEAKMATLSARRAVVDELIAGHRGRIANTAGDSVLAEFTSVLDAVHCAIEIQVALRKSNESEPEGRRMRFRIGVNVGDVMVKDDDIFGDGVNVAAQLEGLVKGGEICVSREYAITCVNRGKARATRSDFSSGGDLRAVRRQRVQPAVWDSVKDGSPEELEAYIEQY